MNLLVKVVIGAVVILVVGYLGLIWMTWRELRHTNSLCCACEKELRDLELAHTSIKQGIELIEENITKCADDEKHTQGNKLAYFQKSLEKNERDFQDAEQRLKEHQAEVEAGKEMLRRLRNFDWLRRHK